MNTMVTLSMMLFAAFPAVAKEMLIGTSVHLQPSKTRADRFIALSRQAGMNSFRADIQWWDVEASRGLLVVPDTLANTEAVVNAGLARGDRALLVLNYGNAFYDKGGFPVSDEAQAGFVRFAEFVVRHFRGRVQHYEVWNEWNLGTGVPGDGGGQATDYARLVRKVHAAIKAIDPSIQVIAGATSQIPMVWITELVTLARGHFDGISVHPYNYSNGPVGRTPEAAIAAINVLNQTLLKHTGKTVPIYLTEMGWPTHNGWNGVTKETSANFMAQMQLLLSQIPEVKGIWWYDFQDDGDNLAEPEQNFGIVSSTYGPKSGYFAIRDTVKLATTARSVDAISTCPGLSAYRYTLADNSSYLAIWSSAQHPVSLLGAASASVDVLSVGSNTGLLHVQIPAGSQYDRLVSERPILVSGELANVVLQTRCD